MSDSVRPHRWQSTRFPRPWDSPGKNTGVGCHFLLQCMKVKSESEVAQLCLTLRPHGLQPARLLHPWDFPGKSTGVGCHCFLSGLGHTMISLCGRWASPLSWPHCRRPWRAWQVPESGGTCPNRKEPSWGGHMRASHIVCPNAAKVALSPL